MRTSNRMYTFVLLVSIASSVSGNWVFASETSSTQIIDETVSESSEVVKAIDLNQKDAVQTWIREGHSPLTKIKNKLKEPLLERAAIQGSYEVFDLLLSEIDRAHLSPRLVDSRGTPLIIALASLANPQQKLNPQYERMIEAMLRFAPKEVSAADRAYVGDGRTALHQAAANGNLNVMRVLISHGAQVNAKNSSNETPMHLAARFGHLEAVKLLVVSGGNIHEKTKHTKATPLMSAAETGHAQIIRFLMMSGAKKLEKDAFGKTAPQRYKEYATDYYQRSVSSRKKQ